jgi:hypothetical protein
LRVVDALEIPREDGSMASSSKKKTTMAKLNREAAVRERRHRKQVRKDARKQASMAPPAGANDTPGGDERWTNAGADAGARTGQSRCINR